MGRKRSGREREVLALIEQAIDERGYGPTIAELTHAMGFSSTANTHRYVQQLADQGLIERDSPKAPLQLAGRRGWQMRRMGQVVAGSPVEAVEVPEVEDFGDLFGSSDHFCLTVSGDSMIDDHIVDGDKAVIRRQQTASDGDIVVALLDGQDATLKRLYREKDRIRLQPANRSMHPIYARDVQILGVLIGVIRRT